MVYLYRSGLGSGEGLRQPKRESGKGLLMGGVKLPLALAELRLIDEYEFLVQPRLTGHEPTLAALSRHSSAYDARQRPAQPRIYFTRTDCEMLGTGQFTPPLPYKSESYRTANRPESSAYLPCKRRVSDAPILPIKTETSSARRRSDPWRDIRDALVRVAFMVP
jgi:hypothetical protein